MCGGFDGDDVGGSDGTVVEVVLVAMVVGLMVMPVACLVEILVLMIDVVVRRREIVLHLTRLAVSANRWL